MVRLYFDHGVEELEAIFRANLHDRQVLGEIRDELTFREAERAKQLLREVEGVLSQVIPIPKRPPKPDTPENQIPLIER
jgi:hypothetical protein